MLTSWFFRLKKQGAPTSVATIFLCHLRRRTMSIFLSIWWNFMLNIGAYSQPSVAASFTFSCEVHIFLLSIIILICYGILSKFIRKDFSFTLMSESFRSGFCFWDFTTLVRCPGSRYWEWLINPFPHTPNLQQTTLKSSRIIHANLKVIKVDNIVARGEIASF